MDLGTYSFSMQCSIFFVKKMLKYSEDDTQCLLVRGRLLHSFSSNLTLYGVICARLKKRVVRKCHGITGMCTMIQIHPRVLYTVVAYFQ